MFKSVFNFSHQRTKKEALLFYIAFLVLGILLSTVASLSMLPAQADNQEAFNIGAEMGTKIAPLYVTIITFLVIQRKNLFSMKYFFIILASGGASWLLGAMIGLIVPTYITTLPSISKST